MKKKKETIPYEFLLELIARATPKLGLEVQSSVIFRINRMLIIIRVSS